ncbi:DUF2946 domain-containing protein [Pseudomonas fluorescens]|uniref:DUF2946 domain-containing protein n=1 Tax=Pseudomonas fluorescens TaxID=294 RepID=A0A5E7B1U0_PSEFL|nr:DUF2946 domain-containing protein [Pseudomonas fluorescens]VVN82784.1 hypothetical protein PS833_01222 [Pseudomonas fluorescens]VVP85075.1 hypothetical protein PS914_02581 [Pseudomonas fluorescens]
MRPLSARSSARRRQPLSLTRGRWIGLFAMLMIFIGPLISQSMPMDQRASALMKTSMSLSMDMGMDMDRSAMAHADHDEQPDAEHCPPQADHHALWEKCGYCSLLFNCPALTGGQSFVAFDTPKATTHTTPSPRLGHARATVFPGARTRAPPIVA